MATCLYLLTSSAIICSGFVCMMEYAMMIQIIPKNPNLRNPERIDRKEKLIKCCRKRKQNKLSKCPCLPSLNGILQEDI